MEGRGPLNVTWVVINMPKGKTSPQSLASARPTWKALLSLLALAPLLLGAMLIIAATADILVWDTPWQQVTMAGLYILVSFVATNALERQWVLVSGWSLLGLAVWTAVTWQEWPGRIMAGALAGVGVALLSREFFRRRRLYLDEKSGGRSLVRQDRR